MDHRGRVGAAQEEIGVAVPIEIPDIDGGEEIGLGNGQAPLGEMAGPVFPAVEIGIGGIARKEAADENVDVAIVIDVSGIRAVGEVGKLRRWLAEALNEAFGRREQKRCSGGRERDWCSLPLSAMKTSRRRRH